MKVLMEFTAKSGNRAILYEADKSRTAVAVDVGWDETPSPQDILECDLAFSGVAVMDSVTIEDPDERDRYIARQMAVQRAMEAN